MPRHNKKKTRPLKPVRVRGKRLSEISTDKVALAMWLMAQRFAKEDDATVTSLPQRDSGGSKKEAA